MCCWNKALNWHIIKTKRSSDFPKFCMSSKWFHGRLAFCSSNCHAVYCEEKRHNSYKHVLLLEKVVQLDVLVILIICLAVHVNATDVNLKPQMFLVNKILYDALPILCGYWVLKLCPSRVTVLWGQFSNVCLFLDINSAELLHLVVNFCAMFLPLLLVLLYSSCS